MVSLSAVGWFQTACQLLAARTTPYEGLLTCVFETAKASTVVRLSIGGQGELVPCGLARALQQQRGSVQAVVVTPIARS